MTIGSSNEHEIDQKKQCTVPIIGTTTNLKFVYKKLDELGEEQGKNF